AIAAVGSVSSAVVAGLRADAKSLLGGDVELRLVHRPAAAEQLRYFRESGDLSAIAFMRAMARRTDGEKRTLIELKAGDAAYPLYGAVRVSPEVPLPDLLARRQNRWGAIVDPILLDRLGLKLGDVLRIGDADFELRGTVTREPDAGGSVFVFGPRVMIAAEAL